MKRVFPSNKKSFGLSFNVATVAPMKLKVQAYDKGKQNTYYYRTAGSVDRRGRTFDLKFPISPNELVVQVFPDKYRTYDEFISYAPPSERGMTISNTKIDKLSLKSIWLSREDLEFIKFAEWFSSNASILSATQPDGIPSIYKSDSGKFEIDYFDKIRDKASGQYVSTPARIGHNSGIIEASKSDFLKYTVHGRMAILLHEYSHKFVNPRTGLKVQDEIGADINALNMYLSLGYSPVEAQLVFLQVFDTANNEYNHKRFIALNDFVKKFMNGELTKYYKSSSDAGSKAN